MKKILIAIVISICSLNNLYANSSVFGKGELKLSSSTVNHFIDYLKGGVGEGGASLHNTPVAFLVTTDGLGAYFWYCAHGECAMGSRRDMINVCSLEYGKDCYFFASRRTVKWKNGINPGKGKTSKFSSKMSKNEVLAKLDELGFIGDDSIVVNDNENIKVEQDQDITQQIKDLNELYKSGVLTKEEFEAAKNKILN